MNIICLDAEFINNEELLELSIFRMGEGEVYHSLYKPVRHDTWQTNIHHITPAMVADSPAFAAERRKVESLLNAADVITGFDVGNDFGVLEKEGVRLRDDARVLDVRNMYWYMRGRKEGMDLYAVPSLLICSNNLGLAFSENDAHSASADTEATLRCFSLLFDEFAANESDGTTGIEHVGNFMAAYEEARARFIEDAAAGYVKVFAAGDVYKIKYGRHEESDKRNLVAEVKVADRFKAEYELRKLLKKKEVPDKYGVYKLTARQLDDIRGYTNIYDAEESAWCKKIIRNLSKLTL